MINWTDVVTAMVGGGILGAGGMIISKINKILAHVEIFSRHIIECEIRNEAHQTLHRDRGKEIDRRISSLESVAHRKHDGDQTE